MGQAAILRVRLYFLVQFMSVGMINAYGGIWLKYQGLSAFEIGVIGAAPVALMLALTLFVGRLADRASDWRQTIVVTMAVAGAASLGLIWAEAFWTILFFWAVMATAQRIGVPVADAAGLRMARREGVDFGSLRALATIGYLAVILGAGLLLGENGIWLFLPLLIGFGLLRAGAAFSLPNLRGPRGTDSRPSHLSGVMKPWFVLPLLGWALIDSNHIILNSFQGLIWADQGIGTGMIGALIALGAMAETVMFFAFRRLSLRFSPLVILLAAGAFSVLRWVGLAFATSLWALVILQLMHALTYAMGFLAVTNFIADQTSEDIAAEAQGFLVTLELAVSVTALVAFGWLVGAFGAGAYLGSAVLAAAGAICVLAALKVRMRP